MAEADNYELELIEEKAVAHIQAMVFRLLDEKKMSRSDLAAAMDCSAAHVSQLLADDPPNLSIKKAARLFYGLGERLRMTCDTIDKMNDRAEVNNARARSICTVQQKPGMMWQNVSHHVSNDCAGDTARTPIAA